jgi:uncharacterized protein YjiK
MKFLAILLCSFSILAAVYFFFFSVDKTEWIMPKELNEISGISFIDDHTLACVQDEKGIIFLYDLKRSIVTKRIDFAGKGDYEGIAVKGRSAYVITGDGTLYEVDDFLNEPKISTYQLNLKKNEESEAICYDPSGNRLLLAFKNRKKEDVVPGLFEFDLATKKFSDSAVVQMDLENAPVKKKYRNNNRKLWQPADISIDNDQKKIYVIDAINGNLMGFSSEGELEQMIPVDNKRIRHPEGIAISNTGSIYICNDANKDGKGKIVKFDLQN